MYHCNIDNKSCICIRTLSKWKREYHICFLLQNPDSTFDNQKANLYKTNRPEFDKMPDILLKNMLIHVYNKTIKIF